MCQTRDNTRYDDLRSEHRFIDSLEERPTQPQSRRTASHASALWRVEAKGGRDQGRRSSRSNVCGNHRGKRRRDAPETDDVPVNTCIYCDELPKSIEHPLPAAFGEFRGAPMLINRICKNCNNQRLGVLDEQLSRCGPEGVLRRLFRVRGRSTHKEVNPHYRGSAGGKRLRMKAFDAKLGAEVELETLGGRQTRQLCQLVFVEAGGRTLHLPIPKDLRQPEKLRAAYQRLGVNDPASATVHLICDPDERIWLEPLIKEVWPNVTLGPAKQGANHYENGAVVELQVNNRYFRAIAKVGFHYFLTQFPEYTGFEPFFSEIKQFITDDSAPVTMANKFIGKRRDLLGEMVGGTRPPHGWLGHVLAAEITTARLAHIQLFICSEYPSPAYTIRLAARGTPIARANGHVYVYYKESERKTFSGEVRPLNATHNPNVSRELPQPFKPL